MWPKNKTTQNLRRWRFFIWEVDTLQENIHQEFHAGIPRFFWNGTLVPNCILVPFWRHDVWRWRHGDPGSFLHSAFVFPHYTPWCQMMAHGFCGSPSARIHWPQCPWIAIPQCYEVRLCFHHESWIGMVLVGFVTPWLRSSYSCAWRPANWVGRRCKAFVVVPSPSVLICGRRSYIRCIPHLACFWSAFTLLHRLIAVILQISLSITPSCNHAEE